MAYTYDDFVSAASKAGMLDKFSSYDLETAKRNPEFGLSVLSLKQDEQNATTQEQKLLAIEAANQLRKTYGSYSGGSDGQGYEFNSTVGSQIKDVGDQIGSFGSFAYDNETEYQKVLDSVTNAQPFQYDQENDPQYSELRKMYLRERDRAVADTLAKVSAQTGGMPSSYAVTAAQQAGDYFTGQLGDAGISLYESALQKHLNEHNLNVSRLEALKEDRDTDYQTYLNDLNILQTKLAELKDREGTEYERYLQVAEAALAAQEAQKQQQSGTDAITGLGGNEDNADTGSYNIELLKQVYPSGVIENAEDWNYLASVYGEEALNAAGLTYKDTTGPVIDEASVIALGYGELTSAQLEQLVKIGAVEMFEEDGVIYFKRKATSSRPDIAPKQTQYERTESTGRRNTGTGTMRGTAPVNTPMTTRK